jgi:hypothetical protein
MLTSSVLALLFAQAASTPSSSTCSGPDPALVSARVDTTPGDSLTHYTVSVTVVNLGNERQASNVLQSVDVFQDDTKVGQKGIPPLAPGKSYTFPYDLERSADAGVGTTVLRLQLRVPPSSSPSDEDCNPSNDRFVLSV